MFSPRITKEMIKIGISQQIFFCEISIFFSNDQLLYGE